MAEHTPTPWEVGSGDDYYIRAEAYPKSFPHRFKNDDLGDYLALVGNRTEDFGQANAAFIVKAVNAHEATQELLVDIWFHLSGTTDPTLRKIADRARALISVPVGGVSRG